MTAGGTAATASPAASAAPCLTFAGLRHCAIGVATLNLAAPGDDLEVRNPGQASGAGVAIDLPDVTRWTGGMRLRYAAGTSPVLHAGSLSGGVVTSRSDVKEVGNRALFSASFTGSEGNRKYTALVLRDGVLVGSVAHVPDDQPGGKASTGWKLALEGAAFVVAPRGSCVWTYSFSSDQSIELPDGQVRVGDTLRFEEEVDPAGAYPYATFDGLTFQGNFAQSDLKGETIE